MYPQYQYPNKDNDITSIKNRVKLMKKQKKKAISVFITLLAKILSIHL